MTNPSTPTFKSVGDCSPNPLKIDAPAVNFTAWTLLFVRKKSVRFAKICFKPFSGQWRF